MAESHDHGDLLQAFITLNPTISFIHYHWIDFCGILNTHVLTKHHASRLSNSNAPLHVGPGAMLGPAGLTAFAQTLYPGGSCCLYPDWSSIRCLGPKHASVVCSISEELTCHPGLDLSNPYLRCPREALKRLIATVTTQHSITFLLGFELEFYLLTEEQIQHRASIPQADCNHWNTASSMRGPMASCVEECTVALEAAGIVVEQMHAEAGAQQFEISTGPLPALAAVDALVQSQEIVKIVSEAHGYTATFLPVLPKPFPDLGSSGMHIHLSMHQQNSTSAPEGSNKSIDNIDQITRESFLAGILHHLPGLLAIGMPSVNSFLRIEPSKLGRWASWGTRNRFTPIRAISNNHWEFRAVDTTANMYLTMASHISAGLLGIREARTLEEKDCRQFLHLLEEKERKDLGITEELPGNFDEAKASFMKYKNLKEVLGEELLALYFDVKSKEVLYMSKLGETVRTTVFLKNY